MKAELTRSRVIALAQILQGAHPDMDKVFTQGACYQFYRVLKLVAPDAAPFYDPVDGHVYVKVGEFFYDINGEHHRNQLDERLHPLDRETVQRIKADDWHQDAWKEFFDEPDVD